MSRTPAWRLMAPALLAATALVGCGSTGSVGSTDSAGSPGSSNTQTAAAAQSAHPPTVRITEKSRGGRRAFTRTVHFAATPLRGTSHTLTLPRGWHGHRTHPPHRRRAELEDRRQRPHQSSGARL